MKLADPRESRFEHLHIGLRRDCLDVLRRHPRDEAVHQLAPGPEAVGGCPPDLGQAGHATLKAVAVKIGQSRYTDRVALVGVGRRYTGVNRRDPAICDRQSHVARPSVWQQGLLEMQFGQLKSPASTTSWTARGEHVICIDKWHFCQASTSKI